MGAMQGEGAYPGEIVGTSTETNPHRMDLQG